MLGILAVFVLLVGVYFFLKRSHADKTKVQPKGADGELLKTLPGPKPLPVIGNVHQLDQVHPWTTFHDWGLEYGPIYQVNLAGHNHIWISDEEICRDLLSTRGQHYSERPTIPALFTDSQANGLYLPIMSRNEHFNRQRKFAYQAMNTAKAASFYGHPEMESKRMLKELLDNPSSYHDILESYAARVTCRLAWSDARASEELKQRARELLVVVSPTGHLANKLPFVMSLPKWLSPPKAWEHRRAETESSFFDTMQGEVKASIEEGTAKPSWTASFFNMKSTWGFPDDHEGAYAVGMHGIASSLLVAAPIQSWCLAMVLYPQYLQKLHLEVDRVCGDRPPCYADLPDMPYLRATIREAFRWRPPVPTGIPHRVNKDDSYRGFHIPNGSAVHFFEWGMTRNTKWYPNPETYNPDRWVDPSSPCYKEPLTLYPRTSHHSQFGFGRRACTGQDVAEADHFVGIGYLAWAFNLRKKINPETGLEIHVPDLKYSSLLIAKPRHFEFDIVPRTEERRKQIISMFEAEDAKGEYKQARNFWDPKNPRLGWGKV